MLASTSTSSTTLLSSVTGEGLKHLYRTILHQARLLSSTLDDPVVFTSHRFLARKNLEPLLSSPPLPDQDVQEWPPSTATKRILRAQTQRRHLADANFGWEHSVRRALALAYARKGKLRRDILSDLSPTTSTARGEQRYPKELRKRTFAPVLQTLLTSASSMNGAPVKSRDHLTGRPPPPFLPTLDDPLVKVFGKAVGRRRVVNAMGRYVKAYMRKVAVPLDVVGEGGAGGLVAELEGRATAAFESSAGINRRAGLRSHDSRPWLNSALTHINRYRSNLDSSAHRSRALRTQGWSSHPKDFSHGRRRRRLYARLLDDVPLLLSDSKASADSGLKRKKNDPLGVRSRLEVHREAKLKVVKSRLAVGPKSRGAEVAPRMDGKQGVAAALDASEMRFLRQQGWM